MGPPCFIRSGNGHAAIEITSKPISCFQPINLRRLCEDHARKGFSAHAILHWPGIPTILSGLGEANLKSDSDRAPFPIAGFPDTWLLMPQPQTLNPG